MAALKLLHAISLVTISYCKQLNNESQIQTKNQSVGAQALDNQSKLANQIIIAFGLLLMIIQVLVWRKQARQQSLITFAVFNKDMQDLPSHTHSQNDFSSGKNQAIEEVINNKDQSPGIKTIKAMTGNSLEESKQGRKKRKRKADKLSDRRNDAKDQNEEDG